MATKVVMEALSPTMEEGRLVKWLKNEGDTVKSGDPLAEVETDKAVMELVARGDGVLRKQLLAEGTASPVGQLIAVIAAPDENVDALIGGGGAGAPAAAPAAAQAGAGVASGDTPGGSAAPPNEVVARTRETAGTSPVPRSEGESQGDASTPP
ncbi:MAG TPA: biotin/lipoyl-containing protein, partial [Gemmatimonadaceae bacterium]|nr:biotin/lipoyl-containing protein [Gemmatimonadaceae bacterium]